MASPHDSLFKATFSDPAEAGPLLAAVLPKRLAALVDWATLALETPESVDATFDRRQADLVFRATIDGRAARLLLVFEHQSTVDARMVVRLLSYMTRVWERCAADAPDAPLPLVVPVVLYHGDTPWTAAARLSQLFQLRDGPLAQEVRRYLPDFEYALDDLTALTEKGLRARALPPWATLTLVLLAWCRGAAHPERVLWRWFETLRRLAGRGERDTALTALARYLLEASAGRVEPLKVVFGQLGEGAEEAFMTPAERLLQQGRRQGRKQGLEQGLERGLEQGLEQGRERGRQRLASLLLAQLTQRFGPPTPRQRQAVEAGDEASLLRWGEQLLSAATLDDALR